MESNELKPEGDKSPEKGSSISRDLLLLVLGAVITMMTTIFVNVFNDQSQRRDQLRKDKISFADELSKSLGKRFNFIGNLYNANFGTRSEQVRWQKASDSLDSYLSANQYYYTSRLRILFSSTIAKQFKDSIDDPFDNFKTNITSIPFKKLDTAIVHKDWVHLDSNMTRFTKLLYQKAFGTK